MSKTYREWVPDQTYMFPPSPRDWLPENEDLGEQRRAPCYTVSFAAADLWPDDGADHTVLVDLWETYLEEEA